MFAAVVLLTLLFLSACSPAPTARKTAEEAPKPPASAVKITQFYADPAVARGGEKVNLCYGVEGAKTVTLDPPVERLWPSPVRCFEVRPTATTTYTLTAEDAAGGKVSQKVIVQHGPPTVKIVEVSVNVLEIHPGEPFPFCVTAVNAVSWKLSAGKWRTAPGPKGGCAVDNPKATTTYVITAVGAMGETDTERVTVTVK